MPQIVDHEARRSEILSRSLSLFGREGYARVTMRGLASHLGVSTGVLYHYFEGKEALFAAMLRHVGRLNVAAATAGLPATASPSTRVAALAECMFHQTELVQQVLMVSIDYQRANPDDPLVGEVLDVYRQALIVDFAQGDRQKAELALSYIIGMLHQRILVPNHTNTMEQLTGLANLFGIDWPALRAV